MDLSRDGVRLGTQGQTLTYNERHLSDIRFHVDPNPIPDPLNSTDLQSRAKSLRPNP